jgi:hypothetical protein
MMTDPAVQTRFDADAFLKWEAEQPEEDWLFHEYLPGYGDCVFPALGVSIPFDTVFENVNPPGEGAGLDDGEIAGWLHAGARARWRQRKRWYSFAGGYRPEAAIAASVRSGGPDYAWTGTFRLGILVWFSVTSGKKR